MDRNYERAKEYFDKYDGVAEDILNNVTKAHDSLFNLVESLFKRLRSKEHDTMCFMFYSICLIKQFGEDETLIVSKETYDWFEKEIESANRILAVDQKDQEDGSMKLSLRDVKDD